MFSAPRQDPDFSVDLECILARDSLTWVDRYGKRPGSKGMVVISVGDVRSITPGVAWTPKLHEPQKEEDGHANPYHASIIRKRDSLGKPDKKAERDLASKIHILRLDAGVGSGGYPYADE
jgi:hypothetical protein